MLPALTVCDVKKPLAKAFAIFPPPTNPTLSSSAMLKIDDETRSQAPFGVGCLCCPFPKGFDSRCRLNLTKFFCLVHIVLALIVHKAQYNGGLLLSKQLKPIETSLLRHSCIALKRKTKDCERSWIFQIFFAPLMSAGLHNHFPKGKGKK